MNKYGKDLAEQYGYTLQSGGSNSTTYIKKNVYLICTPDGNAALERILGAITCRLGPFSQTNELFPVFERQIRALVSVDDDTQQKLLDMAALLDDASEIEPDDQRKAALAEAAIYIDALRRKIT